ncbi:integrase [Hamadaea flava]|uniref:Tyrosine-type recombinase/integrase n=1 Tax=Hamadaea flava TaxID=1742688 RepID=A0ABV8M064_9ACTN|nr:tyrosine-type recombinase/integrase [Hamadaea flava]MCP2323456.1 integrase [Hamadaea flava]
MTRSPTGTKLAQQQDQPGVVYRRCGCRGEDGKQLGFSCPGLEHVSHGRWYFAVQVDGVDGRRTRIRKGGFATEPDARRAMAQLQSLPSAEAVARTWTVGRWLRFWLADIERHEAVRASTLAGYRRVVDGYLIPELGHIRVSKLRTKKVQRALDRIASRHTRNGRLIAASTVHGIRAVLRSALSHARRTGLVGFNAAWRIKTPNGVRAYPVVWTPAREREWRLHGVRPRVACWDLPHLGRFLEAVQDDRLFALWWLVALHGLRRGELAGLRWQDLDLVGRELTVREQMIVIDGQTLLGPPKSEAGRRTLALDETSVKIFRQYRREQARLRGGKLDVLDPLFTRVDGNPVRPDWLTREFQRRCADLGLPPVRLHDIRHGSVSIDGAAGVPLKLTSQRAGHSSVVTTVDIYQHVFPETAHAEVAKTAALILRHAKLRMRSGGASQA